MKKIKVPGTDMVAIHMGTDKEATRHERLLQARHEFCLAYMKEKGWGESIEDLTIDQVLEMREQPGWQDPLKETN